MIVDYLARFIRKKLVLCIVFIFSLTYCIYNFSKDFSDTRSVTTKSEIPPPNNKLFAWNSDDSSNRTWVSSFCRNSIQGKYWLTDDRGYTCRRTNVLSGGCCDVQSSSTVRYSCKTCKDGGCCGVYEYCVSCCMHPKQRHVLESTWSKVHPTFQVVLSTVNDQFELCVAKCRTDSRSVHHENTYRNPATKFCYGISN